MNVNTRGSVYFNEERGINKDAFDFETIAHSTILRTIRLVKPKSTDVVFVLGSAKGRAVCHLARQHVRKVIGIEISEYLCMIAKENIKKLRRVRAEIEICNFDAAAADVGDGTVFFMFNPFGEKTLRQVLKNIESSHDISDSSITIIYVNALFSNVFDEFPWLSIAHDYKRIGGGRVIIYKNK